MQAALAQTTNEVFISLVEINHEDLAQPIYLCDDSQDTISNGNTYTSFPFTFTLPNDESDQEPQVKLVLPNVDRRLIEMIRSITGGPTVKLSVVLASAPNDLALGPVMLKAVGAPYTAETIQLSLSFDSYSGEPLPHLTQSPQYFPSMFK
jgi:hypothetical protein